MKAFDVLCKDNFLDDEELKAVWGEIEQFYKEGLFQRDKIHHGSAEHNGEALASRQAFFPIYYKNWRYIQADKASQKLYKGITEEFSKLGFANHAVLLSNTHNLIYSLYVNGDDYKKHRDNSCATCLIWLCKEPQKFKGGDIYFEELDKKIEFKNNRMVMFPGWALHQVSPVVMDDDEEDLNGRVCITIPMWYQDFNSTP